jgi:hypothetical protein
MNFKRNQVKKKFGIVRGKDGRFKRGYRYIQLLFVRTAEEMVEVIPQGHSNIYWSNLNWGLVGTMISQGTKKTYTVIEAIMPIMLPIVETAARRLISHMR